MIEADANNAELKARLAEMLAPIEEPVEEPVEEGVSDPDAQAEKVDVSAVMPSPDICQ